MTITLTKVASLIWRDYITDGVSASGKYNVDKADVRTFGGELVSYLNLIGDFTYTGTQVTSDWDGAVTAGNYWGLVGVTNAPGGLACKVFVTRQSSNEVAQMALATGNLFYVRTRVGGTWGSWKLLADDADLVSAENAIVALQALTVLMNSYTTTATSAGTLTITVANSVKQFFTGTTTHTLVLPVASTLTVGKVYEVTNNSTGIVTVQSSGLNEIAQVPAGAVMTFSCVLASGTSAASWGAKLEGFASTIALMLVQLGLTIGTNVQAYDTDLAALAAIVGVQGDLIYRNATEWARLGKGTSGQVLAQNSGLTAPEWVTPSAHKITWATPQAATSGTALDFTGIPATATEVYITFSDVSLSGTDNYLVQIGDSGGIETTNYGSTSLDTVGIVGSSSGFIMNANGSAGAEMSGIMTLLSYKALVWMETHAARSELNTGCCSGGGSKTLTGTLDRVRVTRTGTNTFDAGEVCVGYR